MTAEQAPKKRGRFPMCEHGNADRLENGKCRICHRANAKAYRDRKRAVKPPVKQAAPSKPVNNAADKDLRGRRLMDAFLECWSLDPRFSRLAWREVATRQRKRKSPEAAGIVQSPAGA